MKKQRGKLHENRFQYGPCSRDSGSSLPATEPSKPVRTLVQVRFEGDGRLLTSCNDLFDLIPGDRVFVSGKLAGRPGTAEKITTRFKINFPREQEGRALGSSAL